VYTSWCGLGNELEGQPPPHGLASERVLVGGVPVADLVALAPS
jgi:hypothetical protein